MENNIPDEVGHIEGYRVFRLKLDSLKVLSYSEVTFEWHKGANEAYCTSPPVKQVLRNGPDGPVMTEIIEHGEIPDPTCGCGFWVYKDVITLRTKFSSIFKTSNQGLRRPSYRNANTFGHFGNASTEDETFFIGKVRVWGKIIEGKDGYRSEFCEIIAIWPTRSSIVQREKDALKSLADKFEIEFDESAVEIYQESEANSKKAGQIQTIVGYVVELSPPIMGGSGRTRPQQLVLGITSTTGISMPMIKTPTKDLPVRTALAKIMMINTVKYVDDDEIVAKVELEAWPSVVQKLGIAALVGKKQKVSFNVETNYYAPTGKTSYMVKNLKLC